MAVTSDCVTQHALSTKLGGEMITYCAEEVARHNREKQAVSVLDLTTFSDPSVL